MEALVGDAAYLVSQHDSRALGAALITIIVESEVVERLTLAARKRSAAWEPAKFQAALAAVYQELAG
jgi:glycosyltransferase involved in cell wall biosynthesis